MISRGLCTATNDEENQLEDDLVGLCTATNDEENQLEDDLVIPHRKRFMYCHQ